MSEALQALTTNLNVNELQVQTMAPTLPTISVLQELPIGQPITVDVPMVTNAETLKITGEKLGIDLTKSNLLFDDKSILDIKEPINVLELQKKAMEINHTKPFPTDKEIFIEYSNALLNAAEKQLKNLLSQTYSFGTDRGSSSTDKVIPAFDINSKLLYFEYITPKADNTTEKKSIEFDFNTPDKCNKLGKVVAQKKGLNFDDQKIEDVHSAKFYLDSSGKINSVRITSNNSSLTVIDFNNPDEKGIFHKLSGSIYPTRVEHSYSGFEINKAE